MYHGRRKSDRKKKDDNVDDGSSKSASSFPAPLERSPTLLQLGGFLVGPQFSVARYLHFIEDFSADKSAEFGHPHSIKDDHRRIRLMGSVLFAVSELRRLLMNLLYVGAFQVGALLVPQSFRLSAKFLVNYSFAYKMSYILICGKLVLYKYVGCCILSGESRA